MFDDVKRLQEQIAALREDLNEHLPRLEDLWDRSIPVLDDLGRALRQSNERAAELMETWRKSAGPTAVLIAEELRAIRQILEQIGRVQGYAGVAQSIFSTVAERLKTKAKRGKGAD